MASANQSGGVPPPRLAVTSAAIPIVAPAAPAAGGGAPAAPQGVFVYVQGGKTSDSEHYGSNYPVKLIRGLAVTQIVIAALAVISQIVIITMDDRSVGSVGVGIWSGVFYAVAGAIGLYSAFRTTGCTVISFMVMCIVAALFGMVFTIFSSIGLGHNSSRYSYYSQSRSAPTAAAGFYGFQVILALTEMVVSIAASAICCRASCCRSNSKAGQVYFQGGDHHPAVPQQQHIELGGFPAMSEAASKTDLDRQESLPPQYDDMLPVAAAAAANDDAITKGDAED